MQGHPNFKFFQAGNATFNMDKFQFATTSSNEVAAKQKVKGEAALFPRTVDGNTSEAKNTKVFVAKVLNGERKQHLMSKEIPNEILEHTTGAKQDKLARDVSSSRRKDDKATDRIYGKISDPKLALEQCLALVTE